MKRKRRTHSAEFKARIAMEAMKGIKPIHQIAADNEVHPVQVSQRKKELGARMAELFKRKNARSQETEDDKRRIAALERKLGQVIIERDQLVDRDHPQLCPPLPADAHRRSTASCPPHENTHHPALVAQAQYRPSPAPARAGGDDDVRSMEEAPQTALERDVAPTLAEPAPPDRDAPGSTRARRRGAEERASCFSEPGHLADHSTAPASLQSPAAVLAVDSYAVWKAPWLPRAGPSHTDLSTAHRGSACRGWLRLAELQPSFFQPLSSRHAASRPSLMLSDPPPFPAGRSASTWPN